MFDQGVLRLTMVAPNPSRDLGQWKVAGELSAGIHALTQALPARYGLVRRRVSTDELLNAQEGLLSVLERLAEANEALMQSAGDDTATESLLHACAVVLRERIEALARWRRDFDSLRAERYLEPARYALQRASDKVVRTLIAAVPGYLVRVQRRTYGTEPVTIEIDIGGELADFRAALERAGQICVTLRGTLVSNGDASWFDREADKSCRDGATIAVVAFLFGWLMGG